ncbi:uncharacterized protein F5Z01DRAFT_338657 [Emericellopsis atlantica]|uniref:Uncharacterized protein n=1 Tax=Emericellopsis atlantica TaxID=2614577 RepID=A0A9P7ZFD0_9HYPO|nr:uncharacterized protein F5Z01DRAFT_338657 [Emericellopsis atlantica]KAG9250960.1 hypothetical protein F5Z01DRAFT_338657 [Emericellopsis atlantica]
MPSVTNQSILIVGGSSGIGFAVAKLCLAENAQVIIASSNQDRVDDAIRRLQEAVPEAKYQPTGYRVDLYGHAAEANLEQLLSAVTEQGTKPLDHIVYTAARPNLRALSDSDIEYFTDCAMLTMFMPLLIGKLGPRFLRPGYTSSITISSGSVAERPIPGFVHYSGYAAAQQAIARSLALNLAPLRVNCVAPGATETELWGERRDAIRAEYTKTSLLGKVGRPEEVAEAYLYLIKNTDATGSVVNSNGGSNLK